MQIPCHKLRPPNHERQKEIYSQPKNEITQEVTFFGSHYCRIWHSEASTI